MSALLAAVLVASLAGTAHCGAMCGPLLAWAAARGGALAHVAYHCGRLATYALLGAIAGAAGVLFDLGSALIGLRKAAMLVAGLGLVAFGLLALSGRDPFGGGALGRIAGHLLPRLTRRLAGAPVALRAGLIGSLSGLLPCGWLYAFVLTAAGAGSPSRGALVMAVFWAGTLPVLSALGLGLHAARPLAARAPRVAAATLVAIGLLTIAFRGAHPLPERPAVADAIPAAADPAPP